MEDIETNRAKQLREAKKELEEIDQQLKSLKARRREVTIRIERLKNAHGQACNTRGKDYYASDNFDWSKKLVETCDRVFHIKSFRSLQKSAINATMSGIDCLLIMPTGGGKSLCFQLPSVMKPGITLVVSPLISLMEDQLMGLRELNVETALYNGQTTQAEAKQMRQDMVDRSSNLKLIYVTPEKLAKSKVFMAQLEKMYNLGRFSRLVIDEVHCCSQWGHDFRPDYKFLGIMKNQFPDTPILGLTATATSEVICDIQKILNIEGCLVLKDSFYRPNLKYEIIHSQTKDDSETLGEVIKTRFKGQSGIVYCLTVKDTEDLAEKLRNQRLRASAYNATLTPELRSKIHEKWYSGVIQVIVATIAFGMGINKMDVRFVVHYSMSKSIENYYQETGRAGRDGEIAYCILFYRFLDTFRATSLFFTQNNALKIIYEMIKFCIDRETCRKKQLAQYFGDTDCQCNKMCDNCCNGLKAQKMDVTKYCLDLLKILENSKNKTRLTALKLMDAWLGKGLKQTRLDDVAKPKHPREVCESIIIHLLINGYLKEDFHFTPYSTISYILPGFKAAIARNEPILIDICTSESPGSAEKIKPKRRLAVKKSTTKPVDSESEDSDIVESKPRLKRRIIASSSESDHSEDYEDCIQVISEKRPKISDESLICLE